MHRAPYTGPANRYSIGIYDRAGLLAEVFTDLFDRAVATAANLKQRYPRKIVRVANVECCDGESDGLTADECEMLDEVL